jgi:beta-N-acetylhexosaminidase
MVGLDVNAPRTSLDSIVAERHLGSVILLGGWYSGVDAVRSTTRHLEGLASEEATGGLGLFIAADQEGGAVQQLRGTGFTRIPSALAQGNLSDAELTRQATTWAKQLKASGINVNLAPVADTVPNDVGTANQPIGRWDREYSHQPAKVANKSVAFLKGMHAAGVATAIKHFPGLGRITGNTDLTATGITDSQTTTTDPYLEPFASGIRAGTDFVMVGSAIYSKIDPGVNAVFSSKIITDDVGAAKSVASVPVADRATRFNAAGGDIVLTAVPSTVTAMHEAITAKMKADPSFAEQVEAAVTRVVQLKVDDGLASCP